MSEIVMEYMIKVAMVADEDAERELVTRLQANEHDSQAWQTLRVMMSGCINAAVRSVKITSPNLSPENIRAAISNRFRTDVLNFDPSKKTKLCSYLTGNIKLEIKKLDDASRFYVRQSSTLSQKSKIMAIGEKYYESEHGKKPTVEELHSTIVNDLGNKTVSKGEIANSRKYLRNEYSSDIAMSDNDGEDITWGDINNTQALSPEDYMEKANKDRVIDNAAKRVLSHRDQKLFDEWTRRGQYKNSPQKKISIAALAINNNMTYPEAKAAVARIMDKVGKEMSRNEGL